MKVILVSALILLCAAGLWGQPVAGSGVVSGAVTDSDGIGMPDADVVLENPAMGVRVALVTSLDGVFEVAGVAPAPGYRLHVTRKAFVDWDSPEFEVLAGRRMSFEITLVAEEEAKGAKVRGALPKVDHSTAAVGAEVDGRQMETLPTNGRRWESLAQLAPAVAFSYPLNTLGIRGNTNSNAYFVDGLLAGSGYTATRAAPVLRVPQDAVQGVQVLASGAPVEFGRAMGGAVNVVTRSGGSGLHGDIYEYFSNHSLNALERYSLGNDLFGKRHQAGFNLGGAVPQSRIFFFTNMEVFDHQGQSLNRITNPLVANSANCKATAVQCASAARIVANQNNVLAPRSEHMVTGLGRLDYRRSERNTLSLAFYGNSTRAPEGMDNVNVAPDGGLLGAGLAYRDVHSGKFEWTGAPADNAINQFRLGLFHDRLATVPTPSGLGIGKASIRVAGTTLGDANPDAGIFRERRTQLVDNLRVSAGAHTAMIGMDWTKSRDWINTQPNAAGTYYYSSLTALAQDLGAPAQRNYSMFTQTIGSAPRDLTFSEFGFYAQDSWKVSPRLRVTGGVRWSKQYIPQPATYDTTYWSTGTINSSNINADPRIGVSYLLDERTVARASFGIFHASHPAALLEALYLGGAGEQASVLIGPTQTSAPIFPGALNKSIPKGTLNLVYATSKFRNPYTHQTTLAVERFLGGGFTASASYVGSRGAKLWTVEDRNLAASTQDATYTIHDASGQSVGTFTTPLYTARLDANYAHIFEMNNGGSSWYRALVLQLRKRMGHSLSAQASYTWSHAMDTVGGPLIGGAAALGTYNTDHRADLGSSATDQRHRAVFNWVWQPRPARGDSVLARYVLNGWELSGIATLASSQPATAVVLMSGQQFSGVSMAFPWSLNGTGGWTRVPFFPVSGYNGDPQYTVNARLARVIPFGERFSGRLAFEAFNLFNSQFNTGVQTIAYTAAGGVLTPVSGAGTGNVANQARSCQVAFRVSF